MLPETSEEEVCFLELIDLDETRRDAAMANEAHKKHIKAQYDKNVKPHIFLEGDLVLLYNQERENLNHYGWTLTLLNMCYRKVPMS